MMEVVWADLSLVFAHAMFDFKYDEGKEDDIRQQRRDYHSIIPSWRPDETTSSVQPQQDDDDGERDEHDGDRQGVHPARGQRLFRSAVESCIVGHGRV
jgi:hypothetical protein